MDWLTILLLLALGFILIIIELFIIPGFTFFGIAGIVIILGSIVYSFMELPFIQALGLLGGAVGVTLIFLTLFFKLGAHKRFLLNYRMPGGKGFRAFRRNYDFLLNRTATTATPLHPAGIIEVDGERFDAVSEGGFIDENKSVTVIKVEGNRIVVRATNQKDN